ncbi:MAG: NYN domain-containing protein [Eggerthellaceae bacterium]|nr:NYN domain-containing protein [Eggerthellaceae bacterium]
MKDRKRMLIVDGFNVLRSGSRYKNVHLSLPDYDHDWFNRAREMLINDVVHYAGKEWRATIVFDGGGNVESTGETESIGGVRVMFSPAGSSADRVIEKLAYQGRENGYEVTVVTSDAQVQDTVFGLGVDRMSAEGFSIEVERYYDEIRLEDSPKIAQKRTVADRIDSETLAKLQALRDGKAL